MHHHSHCTCYHRLTSTLISSSRWSALGGINKGGWLPGRWMVHCLLAAFTHTVLPGACVQVCPHPQLCCLPLIYYICSSTFPLIFLDCLVIPPWIFSVFLYPYPCIYLLSCFSHLPSHRNNPQYFDQSCCTYYFSASYSVCYDYLVGRWINDLISYTSDKLLFDMYSTVF